MIEHPLFKSARIYRFVEAYVACRNGAQAAREAGYSVVAASETAARLLADARVQALVEAGIRDAAAEAVVTSADVLKEWLAIASADPSQIVKVRRCNCRHCYGLQFGYQWEAWAYSEAAAEAIAQNEQPPAMDGGFGYQFNREPNPDCPRCLGEGHAELFLTDTTTLTGPARKLISSIKQGKHGIELTFRDQDAALLNVAKFLGMLIERKELSGPGGKPIPVNLSDLPTDPQALALAYSAVMKEGT